MRLTADRKRIIKIGCQEAIENLISWGSFDPKKDQSFSIKYYEILNEFIEDFETWRKNGMTDADDIRLDQYIVKTIEIITNFRFFKSDGDNIIFRKGE